MLLRNPVLKCACWGRVIKLLILHQFGREIWHITPFWWQKGPKKIIASVGLWKTCIVSNLHYYIGCQKVLWLRDSLSLWSCHRGDARVTRLSPTVGLCKIVHHHQCDPSHYKLRRRLRQSLNAGKLFMALIMAGSSTMLQSADFSCGWGIGHFTRHAHWG
jgi:hypothetical protein